MTTTQYNQQMQIAYAVSTAYRDLTEAPIFSADYWQADSVLDLQIKKLADFLCLELNARTKNYVLAYALNLVRTSLN